MGFCRSVEGGGLSTQVATYKQGASQAMWKQVGRPKFEDITLSVGMGLSPKFYKWIAKFFDRDTESGRKNGSITLGDFNYVEKSKRTFTEAIISEVQVPVLDAASKDAAFLTVKIVPEGMTYETLSSNNKLNCPPGFNVPQRLWHAANFKFTIDGHEQAFARTMKIDQFTIKQQILEYWSGNRRTPARVAGNLEWPNITAYIPSVDAQPLTTYVTDRLLTYKAPAATRMTGAIVFLGHDGAELGTIKLEGVDIISSEPTKADATADAFAQNKVQLQVESMRFEYKSDAVLE